MKRAAGVLAALALLFAAGETRAQKAGPNGGMLGAPLGGHQVELVLSPTDLTVYIIEKGKVHETTGAKVRAVIQHSGNMTTVELADQGGKLLLGTLREPLQSGEGDIAMSKRPTPVRGIS
jgi:hypothetical protein